MKPKTISMKIFYKLMLLLVVSCVSLSVACTKDSPKVEEVSTELEVIIDKREITIDGNGGQVDIGYTILNGINGIDIVAEADVTWIEEPHK